MEGWSRKGKGGCRHHRRRRDGVVGWGLLGMHHLPMGGIVIWAEFCSIAPDRLTIGHRQLGNFPVYFRVCSTSNRLSILVMSKSHLGIEPLTLDLSVGTTITPHPIGSKPTSARHSHARLVRETAPVARRRFPFRPHGKVEYPWLNRTTMCIMRRRKRDSRPWHSRVCREDHLQKLWKLHIATYSTPTDDDGVPAPVPAATTPRGRTVTSSTNVFT